MGVAPDPIPLIIQLRPLLILHFYPWSGLWTRLLRGPLPNFLERFLGTLLDPSRLPTSVGPYQHKVSIHSFPSPESLLMDSLFSLLLAHPVSLPEIAYETWCPLARFHARTC